MKILTFLLMVFLPLTAFAQDWTIEMRAASYQPSSRNIRKVYSQYWIDYEVLASKSYNDYFDFFAQVSWAVKKGLYHDRVAGFRFKDHTRAWVLPLNLGMRAYIPLDCRLKLYVGAAVSYSFLSIESHTNYSFVRKDYNKQINKSNWGALAKVGLIFDLGDNVFLDLFTDYLFQKFDLGHQQCLERGFGGHFDASGFKFGGGLGVNF